MGNLDLIFMLHILSEHTCLILHVYVIWMKQQFCFSQTVMPGNYTAVPKLWDQSYSMAKHTFFFLHHIIKLTRLNE